MSESHVEAAGPIQSSGKSSVDIVLLWAVIFGLLMLVSLVLYGMMTGVFGQQPPKTLSESVIQTSKLAVKQNPDSGTAWAQYARAQYASGQKDSAWKAIADARKKVKDDSIVWVNCQEVEMLIREGKNEDAVKKSKAYMNQDIQFRNKRKLEEAKKGVRTPAEAEVNDPTIRMFILSATAETNLKRYKDAVIDLSNALVLDPKAADVLALRGWANMDAGNMKAAKLDFDKAKQILPNDPVVVSGLKELAERAKSGK